MMTTSITKPNAPLVPQILSQSPSKSSFIRSFSGSVKQIKNDTLVPTVNSSNTQPNALDANNPPIRTSNSMHLHFNQILNPATSTLPTTVSSTNMNDSSFINSRLRSSLSLAKSTSIKNSPIPPPRVNFNDFACDHHSLPVNLDMSDSLNFNMVRQQADNNMSLLTTFKDVKENANGGRLSRNSTFTGSLRTNEAAPKTESKSPKSADFSETSKLALKKSKMDKILRLMNEEIENEPVYENEINTTDDDETENNLVRQTPIRNGMSANGDSNGKAIRSDSYSRSSTVSPINQKQQAPVTMYDDITENDCIYDENNSYDNKIYLSANCLDNEIINIDDILSNIDNLKETHIISPNDHLAEEDRAIVDVETGEIFNISNSNQQQPLDQPPVTCNDLVDLNNEVRNLILESDEQSPKVTIVKRLNAVGGDEAKTSVNVLCDSNRCLNSNQCLYCKLKELDTPMSTAKSQRESHDNVDTDHKHHTVDNCVYCRLKENNKQTAAKIRSDKNEMQNKRPASSSALVVTWNANGQQKNSNNNNKNFTDKSSSSDDLLKTNKSNGKQPAMVMVHDRTKSNPGKPDGLQRSKSASNALKLPISSSGTQTSAENTSSSSDGSKENLVDGRQKSQKMQQTNLSLNKRKCSVNAEELKRRRSENEKDLYETARDQQAVDFYTQQNDLSSSETTAQARGNVKTKIKLMELKYSTNMTSQDEQPIITVDQVNVLVSDVDPNKTSKSAKQQTQSLTTSRTNQFEIEKNQAMPNPNIHAVIRRQSSPNEVSTTTSLATTPPPPFNVRHTNQIANNVFIVESPPSNGSMSDMDLLALKQEEKRQTVKQLKSKFESK